MGPLLIDDSQFIMVTPSLVRACDGQANDAIVLQTLHFWLGVSTNERDGHRWVWNTYGQWSERTGLSPQQVRRSMKRLEATGVVVAYQPPGRNRTRWYRIDRGHAMFAAESHVAESPDAMCRNRHMDVSGSTDGSTERTTEELQQPSLVQVESPKPAVHSHPDDPPRRSMEGKTLTRTWLEWLLAHSDRYRSSWPDTSDAMGHYAIVADAIEHYHDDETVRATARQMVAREFFERRAGETLTPTQRVALSRAFDPSEPTMARIRWFDTAIGNPDLANDDGSLNVPRIVKYAAGIRRNEKAIA